jgi:hypothetical protein
MAFEVDLAPTMLGAHGHPDWLDLSEFVVHFTKGDDDSGYNTIMSILWARVLRRGPNPFGAARKIAFLAESQRAVCFSEAPLGFMDRIAKRRNSRYGIGFHKRFILDRGGAPLWYLEWGTPQQIAVKATMDQALLKGPTPDDPIWNLTPFIDFPSGPSAPYSYDFRWEREWRVVGDVEFSENDVAFLFIPEERHSAAWGFFQMAVDDNIGPGYFCPYLDPTWTVAQVEEALASAR